MGSGAATTITQVTNAQIIRRLKMSRAKQTEDRKQVKRKRNHGTSQRGVIKLNHPSAQKLRHSKDHLTGAGR